MIFAHKNNNKNIFCNHFFSSCEKGEEYNQISRMELESQSLPPTYSVQNNSNSQPMSLNPVLLEGPRYAYVCLCCSDRSGRYPKPGFQVLEVLWRNGTLRQVEQDFSSFFGLAYLMVCIEGTAKH